MFNVDGQRKKVPESTTDTWYQALVCLKVEIVTIEAKRSRNLIVFTTNGL